MKFCVWYACVRVVFVFMYVCVYVHLVPGPDTKGLGNSSWRRTERRCGFWQ